MIRQQLRRVALTGTLGLLAVAVGAASLTLRDGAYTAAQAERGVHVYEAHCLACHDVAFYRAKLLVWQSATVADLFDALAATMPSENPGVLSDGEYLDVLAYIFSITGAPAGEVELTLDNMASIEIVEVPAVVP
jgi:mono/diheme cytochrome c family protein